MQVQSSTLPEVWHSRAHTSYLSPLIYLYILCSKQWRMTYLAAVCTAAPLSAAAPGASLQWPRQPCGSSRDPLQCQRRRGMTAKCSAPLHPCTTAAVVFAPKMGQGKESKHKRVSAR